MNVIGPLQQRVTRLIFFVAGFGTSAWAPLVPYAKERLALSEHHLGLLLLCLGVGSLIAMPLTGVLSARFGCRPVILISSTILLLALPGLALAASPWQLAVILFIFGGAVGTLDVAMNIQAVMVEKAGGGSMMSGFHAHYSVGGFAGAGSMALMLWLGMPTGWSCVLISAVVAAIVLYTQAHHLREPEAAERDAPLFVLPHGAVIFIGCLCFIMFLAEGAMLDWSALFLTAGRGLAESQGGLGYAAFAVAMTVGRFSGDAVVRKLGGRRVLLLGGLAASAGFLLAVFTASPYAALLGFVLIGLGASNIVPILFTAAGAQTAMPASLAVAAITTLGYTGILAGPALIGFIAHASSLNAAFVGLGCAVLLVAASARIGGPARQSA
ncbi:MFS transporter [Chitinimonas sp.]|uniref:MFS transporter n=1 Tax=Chitinimonas sp. TaxID=1934313 RepID=UPI002F9435BC